MNLKEDLLKTIVGPQWSRIGIKHHHGIDVSLPSLHSKDSCGIGEFYDLIPLIDWCARIGMDVIQLLPLNDTGDDTSPFFALSAMALNPLFLSLHKLPKVKPEKLEGLRKFNSLPRVPYHDVQSHKSIFLRHYFEEMGPSIIETKAFETFVEENDWVENYALFKALKDVTAKNHWKTWPKELQNLSLEEFDNLIEKHWVDVCYYIFLQYLCFCQLTEVKKHANSKAVFLKGDIPILISPDSADVWKYTEEFDLTLSAGAPPDMYNKEGQMWGLPIFNWDVMKKRNFDWWKTRLNYASNFYDIYRIDHILGFFRIYAIPQGKTAKNGVYVPKDKADWLPHGKEILSTLTSFTPMLPIGEDLGDVPDSVRDALCEMGISGTKVLWWEKQWNDGEIYINPLHYNPISMSTVSTHDSETLSLWWHDEEKDAKDYAHHRGWDYTPTLTKSQRRDILRDSHKSASLFHINLLGEYLALFPELVWDDPHDERINVPGTIAPTNWTYRVRPTIEEIISHKELAEEIQNLL